jgi:hypothetical protein
VLLRSAPAFGGTGADQVALNIGQAVEHRQHQAPGAGAGIGPRFRELPELRLGVHDALDDAEQIEGAAGAGYQSASPSPRRRGSACRASG